ncbi:MAG: protein kinase [Pirellulaceae bacterium]|nr:protein kinase [Pirellulaceae bacterium]
MDGARDWFEKAREIPVEERSVWLRKHCTNGDIREEVEELLRFDLDDPFLEDPLVAPADRELTCSYRVSTPSTAKSFSSRYKLLQPIGEGGFGIVYMAEQTDPVRRRVAIKLLRWNTDSKSVIARFETERQALAMMDHPNIARIYDGGVNDDGVPFFVMELVNGVPITDFCDSNQLSTADRMRLLIVVCHAVQHAHQKGIIHRDLKPSNILVSLLDGTPIPKVIDFGIAKALHGPLTDKTLFTAFQQMIGTPEYMSPEQAETSILDADTRSDVFSLGVLAYELLTGTTPFDGHALRKLGFAEIQRTIREVDPPKPSDRVSTLGDQGAFKTSKQGINHSNMYKAFRGDLDWIVMKAMEKDRNRRYSSALSLAEDIRRWLENEPVEARPPSTVYRTAKFVRKHRTKVGIALILTLATILSAVGLGFGLSERQASAERQENAKIQNLQLQKMAVLEADNNRSLRYGNAMIAANQSFRNGRRATTMELLAECPEDKRGVEWNWLSYLASDRTVTILQGSKERAQSTLAYASTDHLLYSAGVDGMLRLWRTDTNQEQQSWRVCNEAILSIQIAENDGYCILATQSGQVILWDISKGQIVESTSLTVPASIVAISTDKNSHSMSIAAGCTDGEIFVWQSGLAKAPTRFVNAVQPFKGTIQSLEFSMDCSKLLAAGKGGVTLFDTISGGVIQQYGQYWSSYAARYAHDIGQIVVFGPPIVKVDATILSNPKLIAIPSTDIIAGNYVSHDHSLVIATSDQSFRRIDLDTGNQETLGYYHGTGIQQMVAADDGRSLAMIDDSGALKILHRNAYASPTTIAAFDCEVASLAALSSSQVFALSDRGEIVAWNANREEELERHEAHTEQGFSLALSSTGEQLVSNGLDQRLNVWSIDSHEATAGYDISWGARYIAMHDDGKHLAGPMPRDITTHVDAAFDVEASRNANLAFWNLETGRIERCFAGLTNWAMKLSFSADCQMLAAATISDGAVVWRLDSNEPIHFHVESLPQVDDVIFSRDNNYLFAAYHNGQVYVWNIAEKKVVRKMICHGDQISGILLTADGSRILTSSLSDKVLRVWDWQTGQNTAEIDSGLSGVSEMQFTDNEQSLILGGRDGRINRLKIATNKPVGLSESGR